MLWLAPLVTGLIGCDGDSTTDDVPPDTETSLPGDDDDDDLPLGTDEASIVVMANLATAGQPDPQTLFAGMFVESRSGFLNLAQCVGAPDSFCVTAWPTVPDDFVLVEDYSSSILTTLETRYVGDVLSLELWSADYLEDPGSGLGYYYAPIAGVVLPDYPIDLRFDGGSSWEEYRGDDDISSPTHVEVTNVDPMTVPFLFSGEPVPLRWVADPDAGEMHLVVRTDYEDRLYLLEDDGEFDLDLSSIALQDGDPVELVLGRWVKTTLDLGGNEIELVVQSNQRITATWSDLGPRVELTDLYDTCAQAQGAMSTPAGNYFGNFSSFANDLNPGNGGCTGFKATGQDAILPIELQPDELLEVVYELPNDDASLYLMLDCASQASCIEGSDNTLNSGTESLTWLNDTGVPVRVYLVLDGFDVMNGGFELTLTITALGGDILVPTCLEAIEQGPVVTGEYVGGLGGNADYLDPACANGAAGGEGLVQVYLESGQTLTADATAAGVDAKLYLLSNCAIADSCFALQDAEAGAHELLTYTNFGASSAYFYLVLDAATNPDEYLLDIDVQ